MTALHCSSVAHSMRWWQNGPKFCRHHHFCTASMVLQLYSVWDACRSALVVGLANFGLCNYRMLCSKFSICSYPVKERDGIVQWFSCNSPLPPPTSHRLNSESLYISDDLSSLPPPPPNPPLDFVLQNQGQMEMITKDEKWKERNAEYSMICVVVHRFNKLSSNAVVSRPILGSLNTTSLLKTSANPFLDHWIGIISNMCCQLSTQLAFSKCPQTRSWITEQGSATASAVSY